MFRRKLTLPCSGRNLCINNQQTPSIDPSSTATLKVTFAKPGNYPYLCTIPGHAEAGMKGVLKVT